MKFARCWLFAGLFLVSGCAAQPYYVGTSRNAFLPARGAPQQLGERRVSPDAIVLETPVGLRRGAFLEAPVEISLIGKSFGFQKGDLLVRADVSGAASGQIGAMAVTLCGDPQVNIAKNLMSASTLGITSIFNRTGSFSQVCLIDGDGDGKLEKAILAGVKSMKDAAPVAIAPTEYRLVENEPFGGDSVARIRYRGETGLVGGHVSFDLEVREKGQPLLFSNVRTQLSVKKLPQRVMLMGAVFMVKSYNPYDGHVVVDVEQGFRNSEYGITTTTTTTYIPIYMPR